MTAMTDDTLPVTPRTIRDEMIAFAIMTVMLAIVPFTGVYPFFVMQALCFALLACAFNFFIGYSGLFSFVHPMFLGTAGSVTAHALHVCSLRSPFVRVWSHLPPSCCAGWWLNKVRQRKRAGRCRESNKSRKRRAESIRPAEQPGVWRHRNKSSRQKKNCRLAPGNCPAPK